MAEPLNEQRKIPGLISNNDRAPQSGFPFGIIVVVIGIVLTIAVLSLTAQGDSTTGNDFRWVFFLLLTIILCVTVIGWIYPKRALYYEMDYFVDKEDERSPQGLNKGNVQKALDGNIFSQTTLLLDLRKTFVNKVLVRKRMTRTDLMTAIEKGTMGNMHMDIDLIWILKASNRDIEDLLQDESNGIHTNFVEWFSEMLRKVEEWQ